MEEKMRTRFSVITVGLSFSFLLVSPAIASPVTSADIEGKKICWSGGETETYYPGGKLTDSEQGDGTWEITGDRFKYNFTDKGVGGTADFQKLDDGTFSFAEESFQETGAYCK